jgi:AcrR family transcriptional regulator
VRRTAEEARRVILSAAERRLREGGPEALRLRDVAADVGVSHPAIIHHFESRDGLARALQARAMRGLQADLLKALEGSGELAGNLLDQMFQTLGDSGHARLVGWYALAGQHGEEDVPEVGMLAELAAALHGRRAERARGLSEPEPEPEDSAFVVRLAAVALLGDALFGPILNRSLASDEGESQRRFRSWLAERIAEHVGRPSR